MAFRGKYKPKIKKKTKSLNYHYTKDDMIESITDFKNEMEEGETE